MTPDQADALAKRIVNVWRGGPNITEWRDELQRLDEGQAGTTFARLKRTQEHAPTIARFIAEYRSLSTGDPSSPDNRCRTCSNSGWTEHTTADGDPAWFEVNGQQYSAAKPCPTCTHGQIAAASQTWTNATRRHIGPKRPRSTAA